MANLPRVIVQIAITGTQIFGKAIYAAGQQAVRNAKYKPQGAGAADAAGVSNATSGSSTDRLTRDLRMTLDEAHQILNVKRGEVLEQVMKHYEYLYKANSPPAPPAAGDAAPKPAGRGGRGAAHHPAHSHYLQSKVVRALERIEAEAKAAAEPDAAVADAGSAGVEGGAPKSPPPTSPPPSGEGPAGKGP